MAVKFTQSWRNYFPGDVATPSGADAPSEEHLVEEEGVAEYVTTEGSAGDSPEPQNKSDPEVREQLAEQALRDRLEGLEYRSGGEGLYGVATDVAAEMGARLDGQATEDLVAFCLNHPDETRARLEGSQ